MKNWLYKGNEITSIENLPQDAFGFIYVTTHIPSNRAYIGKKSLYYNIKRKLTKKELAEQTGRGRKSTTQVIQKESDWKTYFGSAKPVQELLKEGKQDEFKREILKVVDNKKLLTYYECKYLFTMGVLEYPESYFNDNILGKFFTRDFGTSKED
jgi:hypothetical protein